MFGNEVGTSLDDINASNSHSGREGMFLSTEIVECSIQSPSIFVEVVRIQVGIRGSSIIHIRIQTGYSMMKLLSF